MIKFIVNIVNLVFIINNFIINSEAIFEHMCEKAVSCYREANQSTALCEEFQAFCDFDNMITSISDRLLTSEKVAIAKWDTNRPIVDIEREEHVLKTIAEKSENIGLDPHWARLFFRDQMDANSYIQHKRHAEWRENGSRPDVPPVDLDKEIRPLIDHLNIVLIQMANSTKILRNSIFCPLLRDIKQIYIRFKLNMDIVAADAFSITLKQVCLTK